MRVRINPSYPSFPKDSLLATRNGEGAAWDEVACFIVGEGRELSIRRTQEATGTPRESMAMKEEQGTKKQLNYIPTADSGHHSFSVSVCAAMLIAVDNETRFCLQVTSLIRSCFDNVRHVIRAAFSIVLLLLSRTTCTDTDER